MVSYKALNTRSECVTFDASYTIGNVDWLKRTTAIERVISDASHSIGYIDMSIIWPTGYDLSVYWK